MLPSKQPDPTSPGTHQSFRSACGSLLLWLIDGLEVEEATATKKTLLVTLLFLEFITTP